MSLALIQESAQEARRLAIAGSPLAVGDFRLKKLLAPLEQAGAKAPVFAQVAKAISELINGTEAESAGRLLALSTLLNAILYTQGDSGTTTGFAELEIFATKCSSTRTTARALKPLVTALTSAGAGRFEIIRDACARNAFNDLRLIDPAIYALGDTYSELGDLVAEKILPNYGPGIVPRLKSNFDLKGKKHDARKLTVMHRLDPDGTLELCRSALDDGSPDVKAAAITCLGKHEDCLPLVLEQAKSKNKIHRAAALEALAEIDRPEVVKLFADFIKGDTLELLARPFRAIRNRQVLDLLFVEGRRVFEELTKGDGEQVPRFLEILDCLNGRKDQATEDFLLNCFSRCDKLGTLKSSAKAKFTVQFSGPDIMDRLTWILYETGSRKSHEAILSKRDVLPLAAFMHVLRSALNVWPPEKVYEEFAPLLEQDKGAAKQKNEILQQIIRTSRQEYLSGSRTPTNIGFDADIQSPSNLQWDPRWLDAGIKADQPLVACHFARPGHKGAVTYLLNAAGTQKQASMGLIIRALARCEYPKITDAFLELVGKKTTGARAFDYELQLLFESARHLPPADLPKLDAFAAKLDEKFVDYYLEALGPLRSMNPPTPS